MTEEVLVLVLVLVGLRRGRAWTILGGWERRSQSRTRGPPLPWPPWSPRWWPPRLEEAGGGGGGGGDEGNSSWWWWGWWPQRLDMEQSPALAVRRNDSLTSTAIATMEPQPPPGTVSVPPIATLPEPEVESKSKPA